MLTVQTQNTKAHQPSIVGSAQPGFPAGFDKTSARNPTKVDMSAHWGEPDANVALR
jgi:hypothetical protein